MLKAVQSNRANTIRRLHARGIGWSERMQRKLSYEAASLGHAEVLACLYELGCVWHDEACAAAARGGHLDALSFLHEHGCPWTRNGLEPVIAVERGDVATFKYLFQHGCAKVTLKYSYECLYTIAAGKGHHLMLEYLYENSFPIFSVHSIFGHHPVPLCVIIAAKHGQIECLKCLHEKGYVWNASVIAAAAGNGELACVTFLHESGCQWDASACREAAKGGHLDCLTYLHEHGCRWDDSVSEYYHRNLTLVAANAPMLACLRYLLSHSCPFPNQTLRAACMMLVARHSLVPHWRWMVKVRPYAWHWYEEHQRAQCAPGGKGREQDIKEIEDAYHAVCCSKTCC